MMMVDKEISDIRLQARFVGITYLVTTLIGLVNNFYVRVGMQRVPDFLDSEFQFRAVQMLDLLMFILVIWMAHALYHTTKSVNKNLAQLVFTFRFGEGLLGCVVVLFTFIPLVILKSADAAFTDIELNFLATMFFSVKKIGWSILFIVMSVGAIISMYLFLKTKYIPKWLGYWGLITYITVLTSFGLQLLLPAFPSSLMVVMAPGALFELTFGIWLLFRGVKIPKDDLSN